MKNPKLQSERWLKQAKYDLRQAQASLENESYAYACFFSEQSSQKSLKAYLMYQGRRYVNIHSIGELLKQAGEFDEKFKVLIDRGKQLDQYYLSSRYPDAVPEPAIPAEIFVKDQAETALDIAGAIFALSEKLIEE